MPHLQILMNENEGNNNQNDHRGRQHGQRLEVVPKVRVVDGRNRRATCRLRTTNGRSGHSWGNRFSSARLGSGRLDSHGAWCRGLSAARRRSRARFRSALCFLVRHWTHTPLRVGADKRQDFICQVQSTGVLYMWFRDTHHLYYVLRFPILFRSHWQHCEHCMTTTRRLSGCCQSSYCCFLPRDTSS